MTEQQPYNSFFSCWYLCCPAQRAADGAAGQCSAALLHCDSTRRDCFKFYRDKKEIDHHTLKMRVEGNFIL